MVFCRAEQCPLGQQFSLSVGAEVVVKGPDGHFPPQHTGIQQPHLGGFAPGAMGISPGIRAHDGAGVPIVGQHGHVPQPPLALPGAAADFSVPDKAAQGGQGVQGDAQVGGAVVFGRIGMVH